MSFTFFSNDRHKIDEFFTPDKIAKLAELGWQVIRRSRTEIEFRGGDEDFFVEELAKLAANE